MTGAAVVDTLLYGLEPLDWLVIAAAGIALAVLVLELRRGSGPLTPAEE